MNALQVFSYHGSDVSMTRNENGMVYVNLTEFAKPFPSKNLNQIIHSQEIKGYCDALSKLQNYSLADLLLVKRGGNNNGTWAHQKVALRVAQKLSPDFAVWVDTKIEELLTQGSTSIDPTRYVPIERFEALQRQANFDAERAQYWSQRSEYHLQMLIDQVKDNVRRLEARVASPAAPVWMTVAGYAALHHIPCSLSMAGGLGRKAAKLCLQAGITPDSIPDPRFGRVNTYPQNILQQVFETLI